MLSSLRVLALHVLVGLRFLLSFLSLLRSLHVESQASGILVHIDQVPVTLQLALELLAASFHQAFVHVLPLRHRPKEAVVSLLDMQPQQSAGAKVCLADGAGVNMRVSVMPLVLLNGRAHIPTSVYPTLNLLTHIMQTLHPQLSQPLLDKNLSRSVALLKERVPRSVGSFARPVSIHSCIVEIHGSRTPAMGHGLLLVGIHILSGTMTRTIFHDAH
mmetsp:Transcript_8403/g.28206  ORF Transcript_8403/g.28206 Transcript_8403/m.28206 type:complete len:216 (-) Transcript_8403:182-829(-)